MAAAKTLLGSVKPYLRHVAFAHPVSHALWPPRLEEDVGGALPTLPAFASLCAGAAKDGPRLLVTAVEATPALPAGAVVVFPERLVLPAGAVSVDRLPALHRAVGAPGPLAAPDGATHLAGLTLLVCAHTKRDFRCATCGPRLAAWLEAAVAGLGPTAPRVTVLRASHVGGHAHAGNVVVYGPGGPEPHAAPLAHWFGAVNSPEQATALLTHFVGVANGAVPADTLPQALVPLWRGDASTPPEAAKARVWTLCNHM
jgi:hypothetical protein